MYLFPLEQMRLSDLNQDAFKLSTNITQYVLLKL